MSKLAFEGQAQLPCVSPDWELQLLLCMLAGGAATWLPLVIPPCIPPSPPPSIPPPESEKGRANPTGRNLI